MANARCSCFSVNTESKPWSSVSADAAERGTRVSAGRTRSSGSRTLPVDSRQRLLGQKRLSRQRHRGRFTSATGRDNVHRKRPWRGRTIDRNRCDLALRCVRSLATAVCSRTRRLSTLRTLLTLEAEILNQPFSARRHAAGAPALRETLPPGLRR